MSHANIVDNARARVLTCARALYGPSELALPVLQRSANDLRFSVRQMILVEQHMCPECNGRGTKEVFMGKTVPCHNCDDGGIA